MEWLQSFKRSIQYYFYMHFCITSELLEFCGGAPEKSCKCWLEGTSGNPPARTNCHQVTSAMALSVWVLKAFATESVTQEPLKMIPCLLC